MMAGTGLGMTSTSRQELVKIVEDGAMKLIPFSLLACCSEELHSG
jgi:hypothetical protein